MKSNQLSRRSFLGHSGKAGIAVSLSASVIPSIFSCNSARAAVYNAVPTLYTQQPLPYAYNALEPSIDALTMEIHYTKHAANYAKSLGEATAAEGVDTKTTSLEKLLADISKYSAKMRNNAGGHYNHELFWKLMAPGTSQPGGALLKAIEQNFGSMEAFVTQFNDAAKGRFGSGWAWLVLTADKKLVIGSTPNQDNPLMNISDLKGFPVMGIDVWEHAYYLKYQNKRPEYITNWWKVLNWKFIGERYDMAIK